MVIGKNIPSEEIGSFLYNYFLGYGFSGEEADVLIYLYEKKLISLDEKYIGPQQMPLAPAIANGDRSLSDELDAAIK